jgi:8-oxo-dGTP diphosphatase
VERPPRAPGRVDVALAIPLRDDQYLVRQRQAGLHLAGYWEFPGGKIDPAESPADAARRELHEETGLTVDRLAPLLVMLHDYAGKPLRFHVFLARVPRGEPRTETERQWEWKTLEELLRLRMPEANRQMLRALGWRV